jgi:uridylate kinase
MNHELPIVISIGGSLIVPNGGIDTDFLKKLNIFVRKYVAQGKRFCLVTGGGKLARTYIDAGREVIGSLTNEDLDWLGIHATRLNAHLMRTIFKDIAHQKIVLHYGKRLSKWDEPVMIGAGWRPGWSTDYCAMKLVSEYKAKMVINLSNVDWVYDSDPKINKEAKIIKKMTWEHLQGLVGTKWEPGTNIPFDPIAVSLGRKLGTRLIITGADFENLTKIVDGKTNFSGTVVEPA